MARQFWVMSHKWDGSDEEVVENFLIKTCIDQRYVCAQYEYTSERKSTVTMCWQSLMSIKEGDVLFLRGENYIYAWGYAIKPRFEKKLTPQVLNCQEVINKNDHFGYTSGRDEDSQCGETYVKFSDCEVFYEHLHDPFWDGEDWGQRIDVDEWHNVRFFYEDNGGSPIEGYIPRSPFKPISKEEAERIASGLARDKITF